MSHRSVLSYFLVDLLIAIVVGTLLGFIFSAPLLGIILGLLILIFWYFYQTKNILNWIVQTEKLYPPECRSFFSIISDSLNRAKKKERNKVKELLDAVKQFKKGAESLPDSMIVLDCDFKINWCNQLAQIELDIRWPNDKGQHITNLLRYPILTQYLKSKTFDKPLTLQSHNKKQIEFRVLPYSNDEWIMMVRDIDHLYLAEQQRQDFFANVSHELKTPLTVIKGYLELYEETPPKDNESHQQLFSTLLRQTNKMDTLISQILLLSKIENTTISNTLASINVPDLLTQIKEDVAQCYPNYQFSFDVDRDLEIKGITEQIQSVITNLIYNAVKHNPEHTSISVEWKRTPQGAYFSVKDSGVGIDSRHLNRLTERFYQVDSSRSQEHQSSGLGLAIVKHSLLNHGNTQLVVKSEKGRGSQFSFTLPEKFILE